MIILTNAAVVKLADTMHSRCIDLTVMSVRVRPAAQMVIADGRSIASKKLDEIKTGLKGRSVSIAAVWAGDPAPNSSADRHSEKGRVWSEASNLAIGRFVEMKKKAAESVGINMDIYHLDSEDVLTGKLKELAEDKNITGIIVELPLPSGYDREKILKLIPQEKDIDVLNGSTLLPPAVRALKVLFEEYQIEPGGKTAAVFGQSILIGKPISHWLEQNGAKVFRIDENTQNAAEISLQADIIVSGVGKPKFITGNMVKNGAIVVDFGFEKLGDKVAGDVDFGSVAPKSSLITPVPGGMGPLVIASFLENALKLYLSSAR